MRRAARCVQHLCRLTDEAELSFPTTIACTLQAAFLYQSWCTRERLFYSFPAPIGPDLVRHAREKQLLLIQEMIASFKEGWQIPSNRICSFFVASRSCQDLYDLAHLGKRYTRYCACWVPLALPRDLLWKRSMLPLGLHLTHFQDEYRVGTGQWSGAKLCIPCGPICHTLYLKPSAAVWFKIVENKRCREESVEIYPALLTLERKARQLPRWWFHDQIPIGKILWNWTAF